jgi:hypothetical protein
MSTAVEEASADHEKKEITIIVNGTQKTVEKGKLSFDQIVKLAYPIPPYGEKTLFSVTYRRAKGEKEHTLDEGQSVEVTQRMMFDVTATDRS